MEDIFARAQLLLGSSAMEKLAESRVAVIGIGGVGSYAVEALARGGVGALLLVDDDRVSPTNINRQLHADNYTIGRYKTKLMAERAVSINPHIQIDTAEIFCLPDNIGEILGGKLNYVIDAVDTVSAKLGIAAYCHENGIPLISCMGAANKLDPTRFEIADIKETSVCPLCRVMRRELKKGGITALRVVYSREEPLKPLDLEIPDERGSPSVRHPKRQTPGSVSFVPPVAGFIAAGEVIKELIKA